jgi:hypothetical protein
MRRGARLLDARHEVAGAAVAQVVATGSSRPKPDV